MTHWRARKKGISEQAHAKRIEANYELSAELYWALYEAQGGKCFGCGYATGKTKRLAVDHDHKLAEEHGHDPKQGCIRCIRALLCGQCNQIIGRLGVEALQRLILVLTDPPARKILCPEVTQAMVDEAAAELGLPAPSDIATAIEPTIATIDEAMDPELIEAIDSVVTDASWIEDMADEDGIPQTDVGVLEFFAAAPPSAEDFWTDSVWYSPAAAWLHE